MTERERESGARAREEGKSSRERGLTNARVKAHRRWRECTAGLRQYWPLTRRLGVATTSARRKLGQEEVTSLAQRSTTTVEEKGLAEILVDRSFVQAAMGMGIAGGVVPCRSVLRRLQGAVAMAEEWSRWW
ncbi:putative proline-rich receptor-like protein kinase PERK2 [Iris pallida]|uniref:Proline-rich receptor-like protein kinase PERK2 n=1 Tax=Iris pallida TaxID=29817 RepID=A0AAX6FSR0_IRIPA|nr:putative proline-rich receptor-like protein kinase PERK2 [Iris pallida]